MRLLKPFYRCLRNESGMTLLEAVLLVLIISITAGPLSRLAVSNLKSTTQSMQIGKVVSYAEGSMEEVISVAKNTTIDNISSGYDFSFQVPAALSRSLNVTQTEYNGVPYAQVTVTISYDDGKSYTLTTLLRDS